MQEYRTLGHMELIPENEINSINSSYLPHHAVYKASSTTTKLRVVLDASCQTSNGLSLNQNLMTGSTIQHDIFTILICFRLIQCHKCRYKQNVPTNKGF